MKRVLLLGDSIRMGYAKYVREYLNGKCEVLFDEQDNGRFAAYTLWQANQFFKNCGKFDAVHWNNGYWDMNIEYPMTTPIHPVEEYIGFLRRIIAEIRRNGAKIIFATTTPVLENGTAYDNSGTGAQFFYKNDWVLQYNEAAKKLMTEEHILINDLYALSLQDMDYYKCEDKLHLTEEGYKVCAEQAARCIEQVLGI